MSKVTVTDRLRKTEAKNRSPHPEYDRPATRTRMDMLYHRRAAFFAESNPPTPHECVTYASKAVTEAIKPPGENHVENDSTRTANLVSEQLSSGFSTLSVSDPRRQGSPPAVPYVNASPEFYDAERFYRPTMLSEIAPSALVSSFNALTSNLFCGTSVKSSAATLVGSKQVRLLTIDEARGQGAATSLDKKCIQSSPTDIRTVYKMFDSLEPKLTVYACCPIPACAFSALIPVIADTLASKKVTGHCGHGGKYFCSRCRLPRSEIHNVNPSSWPKGLTRAEHEAYAEGWRTAPNKSKQESFLRAHGVRWSALLLLKYWQPSDWSITEGVHVLLLGVTARHCRDLLGLNFSSLPEEDDDEPPSEKRMEHARQVFNEMSPRKLHKLNIDALKQLCIERNVSIPHTKGRRSKKTYVSALLGDSSPRNAVQSSDLNLGTFFDDHVEEVLASDIASKSGSHGDDSDAFATTPEVITQQTLILIREHIQATLRPDWQAHLPPDFGSPSHGKLKADQWRTALEFDIPVSLIQVLANHKSTGNIAEDAHLNKIVEHTLDLAMALAWGLSRRTSAFHAERYNFYMQRYLDCMQTLFPEYSLKPNHHYALHISEILLLFGPLHGTWAFSLERLIGRLQKLNTNCKIGDMENTAMHMFCRRSNLVRLMESADCPACLVEAWSNFRNRLKHGDLNQGLPCQKNSVEIGICSGPTPGKLDRDILQNLELKFRPQGYAHSRVFFDGDTAQRFRSYERRGIQYTDFATSEKHSLVYFTRAPGVKSKDGLDLYLGQIRQIFQHSYLVSGRGLFTDIFVAIHAYIPLALGKDPFSPFVDFRAAIFQLDPSPQVEVIRASQIQCHANQRPWGKESVVMRAIDREY